MNFSFENKNPNQKPSIFPALIILPGTHRRYKNEKPSIKWVLFTNASHNTILHFVAIRFMSIQMLKSTQCTEVGFTNWYSCNKITKTQIQISRQNLFWVFLNMQQSHNVFIIPSVMVFKSDSKWDWSIKPQNFGSKLMKLANQILSNYVQMLIFCLSYIITTVYQLK